MRLVNWNIEWMNDWFVGGGSVRFREDNIRKGITDVSGLCRRVANVIMDMNPDVLTIQEGPSDIREMSLFIEDFLVDDSGELMFAPFISMDGGAQKIYALVRRDGEFRNPVLPTDDLTLSLQDPFEVDISGDYQLEGYEFTRLPLVVEGTIGGDDTPLRIVVLHTKSKYVHNGRSLWNNPETRMQFVTAAMRNRRRISAEAMRTRQYLDQYLESNRDALVVVTGDFNDGPGVDYFERHYLTNNVTDILLGSTYYPNRIFQHTFIERVPDNDRFTARFDDFVDDIPNRPILLDHILVSPALAPQTQDSGIAHQEYDRGTDSNASGRQEHVSDHRPVYLDL